MTGRSMNRYKRFKWSYCLNFKGKEILDLLLKIKGLFAVKTSVNIYHSTVSNIPEESDVVRTVHHIAMCRWPKRCTVLINNFLFHHFFSCSTCFERITRSSSGALPSILYHVVWYNRYNGAGESSCSWTRLHDERVIRSKHVEQEKMVE